VKISRHMASFLKKLDRAKRKKVHCIIHDDCRTNKRLACACVDNDQDDGGGNFMLLCSTDARFAADPFKEALGLFVTMEYWKDNYASLMARITANGRKALAEFVREEQELMAIEEARRLPEVQAVIAELQEIADQMWADGRLRVVSKRQAS